MFINRKADFAVGAISVMANRDQVIDYSIPFYENVGFGILKKKFKEDTHHFKFVLVMNWTVWATIAAAYLITTLLLWTIDWISPYSFRNNLEKYADDEEQRYFTLKESNYGYKICITVNRKLVF